RQPQPGGGPGRLACACWTTRLDDNERYPRAWRASARRRCAARPSSTRKRSFKRTSSGHQENIKRTSRGHRRVLRPQSRRLLTSSSGHFGARGQRQAEDKQEGKQVKK